MRIAILTEGDSEYVALPELFSQLNTSTGNVFLSVIKLAVQPDGPPLSLARECKAAFKLCAAKNADLVILVLDRESQVPKPGTVAATIHTAIATHCSYAFRLEIVIKDRTFENWVIADLDALSAQPARYRLTGAFRSAVSPNKADNVPALQMLSAAVIGRSYDKKVDGKRTLAKADVLRLARNSRSFRHFLHVVGEPTYSAGCVRPVA